jgi:hypothetical protein
VPESEGEKTGGVRSIFTVPEVVEVFPALSLAAAVMVWVPSEDIVSDLPSPLMETLATPEVASVAEADTVTGKLSQPFEPFGEGMSRLREGGTVSSRKDTVPEADELPALSVAWKETVWLPSPETETELPEVAAPPSTAWDTFARPEVASAAPDATVTAERYQPPEPAVPDSVGEKTGGVRSIFTVPDAVAVFPALSVATAVTVWIPSEETVSVLPPPLMETLATPEVSSVAEADTVTGDRFQPFEPFGEGMSKVRAGGWVSTWKFTVPVAEERLEVAEVAWKWAVPTPSGRPREQVGPGQEKPVPLMSPLIVVA